MEAYELTVVLPGKITAAKKKDAIARIEKIVNTLGGRITESNDWGIKDLAYTIKKNDAGVFFYSDLKLPKNAVAGLNEKLKLEDDIIRHLLVKKD